MILKPWRLTLIFCAIWALTLLYGEIFAFWVPSLWSCSWPHPRSSTSSQVKGDGLTDDFVRVAVVADPQLTDRTSLPLPPKSPALEIVEFYSDLYMRRAFFRSILPFKPDVVLFLGDYLDGGHILSYEEWEDSLSRFKHIFDLDTRGITKEIKVYYIPGNHDIGYAAHIAHNPEVIKRYEREFGARNHKFTVGKVDFIAIDAQTVDGNPGGTMTSKTGNFVKEVSNGSNPRVLLTHIPLYRPDWTSCGPYRYSAIINQRISHTAYSKEIIYQNYVSEQSSKHMLDMIQPALVLSGHDHDQCSVTHNTKRGHIMEHTVGTISWQQGNLLPSFMLLSASNNTHPDTSSPETVIYTQLCFLPNQTFIYIWYLIFCVMTIFALIFWPSQGIDIGNHLHLGVSMGSLRILIGERLLGSGTKEKREDEDWEMVWDAEGCMHLVRKPLEESFRGPKDTKVVQRGSATMRPNRRQPNQLVDQELADGKGDEGGNSTSSSSSSSHQGRSSKTRMKMVIQRVLRMVGMVSVIALSSVVVRSKSQKKRAMHAKREDQEEKRRKEMREREKGGSGYESSGEQQSRAANSFSCSCNGNIIIFSSFFVFFFFFFPITNINPYNYRLISLSSSSSSSYFTLKNKKIIKILPPKGSSSSSSICNNNNNNIDDLSREGGEWVLVPDHESYYNSTSCRTIPSSKNCYLHGRPDAGGLIHQRWRWRIINSSSTVLAASPATSTSTSHRNRHLSIRFEPVGFLNLVVGKTLAFIGDSVARNHVDSLICMLAAVELPIDVYRDAKDRSRSWHFKRHNFTLMMLWTKFLVKEKERGINGKPTGIFDLQLDKVDDNWAERLPSSSTHLDYVVISTSQWFFRQNYLHLYDHDDDYNHTHNHELGANNNNSLIGCTFCGEEEEEDDHHINVNNTSSNYYIKRFEPSFAIARSLRTTLQHIINRYTTTTTNNNNNEVLMTIIVRTISPSHFENGTWKTGGSCNRKQPLRNRNELIKYKAENKRTRQEWEVRRVQMEEVERARHQLLSLSSVNVNVNVEALDITEAMMMRPDGHPGPYWRDNNSSTKKNGYNDCVHWCLPGPVDTWNDFLLAILRKVQPPA